MAYTMKICFQAEKMPCTNEELKDAFNSIWVWFKKYQKYHGDTDRSDNPFTDLVWTQLLQELDEIENRINTPFVELLGVICLAELQARALGEYRAEEI